MIASIILNFVTAGSDQSISFDRDDFVKLKNEADQNRTALNDKKNEIVKAVDEMRAKWNTPAGKEFFKNLDSDWASDIQKYLNAMQTFIETLDQVEKDFSKIENVAYELQNLDLEPNEVTGKYYAM